MSKMKLHEYDYVIVGSGIAGLSLALKVNPRYRIAILNKSLDQGGSSNWAQGGIASAVSPKDSASLHIQDTLNAGAGLCKTETVQILAEEGPSTIQQLIDWGVEFTREQKAEADYPYHLVLEGGHSCKRILHSEDLTGAEIMRAVIQASKNRENIDYFDNFLALDLHVCEGRCTGLFAIDRYREEMHYFNSRITVLATGGIGSVFLHSTNPRESTGDGIGMALRAGAPISDLEFMQFHPTSLFEAGDPETKNRSFLISEAVRGHGAILRNHLGEAFMAEEHPLKDLAPRDVVARAIDRQMKIHQIEHVYLDITHLQKSELKEHFPNIYQALLERNIVMEEDWIPVVPAAHYICGGVEVDTHSATAIPGLYAIGEASCTGVHGANRLASNSLLESVVFAERAFQHSQELIETFPFAPLPAAPKFVWRKDPRWRSLKKELRSIMWRDVGIVRNTEDLKRALRKIRRLQIEIQKGWKKGIWDRRLVDLRNMVAVSEAVIISALLRKESRGLHTSSDYPESSDAFLFHLSLNKSDLTKFKA